MDDLFSKVWKDEITRNRIILILINTFFAIVCAFVTQNIVSTVMFVVGVAIIDILVEICKYINFEKLIYKIFAIKWYIRYSVFIFAASLPTILGIILKEIDVNENLAVSLCINLVPNILGALIVCSFFDHISKFGYKQITYSIIRSLKDTINVLVRVGFLAIFINSVNYDMNSQWKVANMCNKVYLFFVIFSGAIVLWSFVLRILDKEYFEYTAKEIYPTKVLFWGGAYLLSCDFGPILGTGKHEPILLLMNSITAGMIAIFLCVFIARRTENESNTYPFVAIFIFMVIIILNSFANLYFWDRTGNILQQLFSGVGILIFAFYLLMRANKKQRANSSGR